MGIMAGGGETTVSDVVMYGHDNQRRIERALASLGYIPSDVRYEPARKVLEKLVWEVVEEYL